MTDLDADAVLSELEPWERKAVATLLDTLGMDLEEWPHHSGVRLLLETVAILRVSADVKGVGSETERVRIASEALGFLETEEGPHPADAIIRRIYRWQARAREARADKKVKIRRRRWCSSIGTGGFNRTQRDMRQKAVEAIWTKQGEEGVVVARFATLGVKDRDGDVIEPGAIGNQRVKVSAYGHTSWGGALPVGVGETREKGDQALADIRFFMNTEHGADHFRTIKGLGDLGEFSFGFDVEEEGPPSDEQRRAGVTRVLKRLTVHEVSPVLRGAGVNTGTVSAKCDGCGAKEEVRVAPEEVERAKELVRTMEHQKERWKRPGDGFSILEGAARTIVDVPRCELPPVDVVKLASLDVRVGHAAHRGIERRQDPPEIRWFKYSGRTLGVAPRDRSRGHHVWLNQRLRGEKLVSVCLHETRHLIQHHFPDTFTEHAAREADADRFAAKLTGPVMLAWRRAHNDPSRIAVTKYHPTGWAPTNDVRISARTGRVFNYSRIHGWSRIRD